MCSTKTRSSANAKSEAKAAACQRLLATLEETRRSGSCPLTVRQLAARLEEPAEDVLKLLKVKELKPRVVLVNAQDPESPVALAEDKAQLGESDLLVRFAASQVRAKRKAKGLAVRADLKKFLTDAGLPKEIRPFLEESLEQALAARSLPPDMAELLLIIPTPDEIAPRLLDALNTHRGRPGSRYPIPEDVLLAAYSEPGGDKRIAAAAKAALKVPLFSSVVVKCNNDMPTKLSYMLKTDLDTASPETVNCIIASNAHRNGEKKRSTAFAASELAARLLKEKPSRARFAAAIEKAAERNALGAKIAWIWSKGIRIYFGRGDAEPNALSESSHSPAMHDSGAQAQPERFAERPIGNFAASFEAAFRRIDARTGRRNFVKLHDLRQELSEFGRAEFDAGLKHLRIARRYSADSAGGAVQLTESERGAGIQEGSSLLVYVSRI